MSLRPYKIRKSDPKATKRLPNETPSHPSGHKTCEQVGKVKPFNKLSAYFSYSTCSHQIQAAFLSLDHQKHGPGNCLPLWHPQSENNHKHVSNVGPRRLPKCILKLIKVDARTSRWLLGVPVDPWITKMVTQCTKMEPQGIKSDPFQLSTSQQFC